MIYLDNAATSFPKPETVYEAMDDFMRHKGANPGRSSHQLATMASQEIAQVRKSVAQLFNAANSEEIVFTLNTTDALDLGMKGILAEGDHVVTSSMEHNSVIRPLKHLEQEGVIELSVVDCDSQTGELAVEDLAAKLQANTKLIVITHASNVTGTLMPIKEIGQLAQQEDIILLVDAAQTAGVYPIDVQELQIDLLAFPGHKGLLGPQGTGGLYINSQLDLSSRRQGGTGGNSETLYQPEIIPDKYESGTPNGVGIAGLGAGIDYILDTGIDQLRSKKLELTAYLLSELNKLEVVSIYGPQDIKRQAPVVSFNLADKSASEIGFMLDRAYEIGVRSGLHCAPLAHQTLGTIEQGTIRVSLGNFTTQANCEELIAAVKEIIQLIN
ncbi:MAG: aminotransferase class V-fold PLP-dependent enzyme [Bacillota bacterium]